MKPEEFWRMHPTEFYWLLEAKKPPTMFGKMTEAEVVAIYEEDFGGPD